MTPHDPISDPSPRDTALSSMTAPRVVRLALTDFRNYPQLVIETPELDFVALVGDNGVGKTNILEAISLLSPGRGLRRAPFDELSRVTSDGSWAIHAVLSSDPEDEPVRIGVGRAIGPAGPERGRRVRIDGEPAKTSDDLLDYLRVLWLTPAMDGLFTGPEADRRRFVDRMVLAIDPGHGRRVSDFETAMRGRNRLLEEGRQDAQWFTAIEQEMASLGIAISLARKDLVARIQTDQSSSLPYEPTVFPIADLSLTGEMAEMIIDAQNAAEAEDAYAARLEAGRFRDRAAGRTLVGPHRDTLQVFHRAKSMPADKCSTGEQKALLLGLVLAHSTLVRSLAGHAPILLLDEVAAHLDARRRAALFQILQELGGQIWMTGTDLPYFKDLPDRAARFVVCDGNVTMAD